MNKIISLGYFDFLINTKRKSFLYISLFLALLIGVYTYRNVAHSDYTHNIVFLLSKFIGYYLVFLSAFVFAKDYKDDFYKNVYSSGMNKSNILMYKTITIILSALLFFALIFILHISLSLYKEKSIDYELIGKCAVIFILAAIHYSLAAALFTTILKNYKYTLLAMLIIYIILPYVYIMYKSLTETSFDMIYDIAAPFTLDKVLTNYDLTYIRIINVTITSTILFIITIAVSNHTDFNDISSSK